MVTRGTIGSMSEFNPGNETVTAYLESFLLFIAANGISDDKKVPTVLTVDGATHNTFIRRLVSPDLPKDKMFDEVVDLFTKHYDPQPIVTYRSGSISTRGARSRTKPSRTIWLVFAGWPVDANSVRS